MARFGRVLTAMVTPFTDDGSLDVDGAAALAAWLQEQGNEGLVDRRHHRRVADAHRRREADALGVRRRRRDDPGDRRVDTNDTAHSVHLTAEASKLGVAGVLALCPYYNRPSQAGIEAHLRAVAEATDLPLVIYDIPVRTGRKISTALLARLAHEVDNIVGLKDAAGNPAETARLIAAAPADYEVYSGDDALTLPLLAVGAVGVISRRRPTGWRPTSSSCSTRGRPATPAAPGASTPGCSRASPSRPGTRRRTRARRRRCCATSASPPATAARRWAPIPTGSTPGPPRSTPTCVRTHAWLRPVRLVFLGGLGEIGRNCMAVEQGAGDDRRILLIDCGLMFPGPDLHGIDLVLPDFTYLRENAERIEALVATHGHEDHVGGIPFLLREISFPIYGSAVTLGLARNRIEEAGLLGRTALHVVADGERRRIGSVRRRVHPRHPQRAPRARHRRAHQPGGDPALRRLQARPHARRRPAHRPRPHRRARPRPPASGSCWRTRPTPRRPATRRARRSVGRVLRTLFAEHRDRRIITASFASHLHRIQQIADAAIESGRRVATLGLSMRKNVQMGIDLGVLRIPASSLIDIEDIDGYPPGEVCVISTGSQGEPMSALALLARGENKFVKLGEHDTVILSSHAIPGNESNVNRVMDGLLRAGAEVVHSGIQDVHATGHAQADELKTYLSIAQPEWYVPVHGEFRHLVANARLGGVMGRAPRSRARVRERRRAHRHRRGVEMAGRVPAGYLYVDGIVGDVGTGVLRDRRVLASEGVVVVVVTVDTQTGKVLVGPEIITRGWVYAPEAEDLLDEACDTIAAAVEAALADGVRDVEALERDVRRAAGRFVNDRTRRRPMIVPVVMEA